MDRGQPLEREAVLAAIDGLLDGARAGRGGVLFVVGEAGLGKTTCLDQAAVLADPEVQVGLGRGDVNKAIAGRLFLSTKTIEYHLAQVYTKLGINSRRQLMTGQYDI